MKRLAAFLLILLFITGCKHRNTPDISHISVNISVERFDKAFFEKTDTLHMDQQISMLQEKFPWFTDDFLQYILGVPVLQATDSSSESFEQIKMFYRLTRPLYDSIAPKFENTAELKEELTQAFKYVKYYFPAYQVPKVVTYIGPFDAPGVAITQHALAIGLQLFAGKDFSFYTSPEGQNLYPAYISRRFEPQYITPNCMKAVINDLFPDNSAGTNLIEQMVEKGKRWYLLDHFLPDTPDSLKTDYTQQQLKWCEKNEGQVWNLILQNTDLYTTDPEIIKNYIGEAPHTEGMTDFSPGNIGQWIGWQIVKAYANKHTDVTPEALMRLETKKIFNEAKYKPR